MMMELRYISAWAAFRDKAWSFVTDYVVLTFAPP